MALTVGGVVAAGELRAETRIIFSAKVTPADTTHELYSMNTNGAGLVRLTTNSFDEIGPAVSPDNSRVAYIREDLTTSNIQIISIGGGAPYTLPTSNNAYCVQWADAQTLYYLSDTAAAGYRLWKIGTNGTGNSLVFTNVLADYTTAYYSFFVDRAAGKTYVTGFDANYYSRIYYGTNTANQLAGTITFSTSLGDEYAPVISPDGSRLAFCADIVSDGSHQLWISSSNGGTATAVANSLYAGSPAWLSTNTLVFVRASGSTYGGSYYEGDIVRVKSDGTGMSNLTANLSIAGRCAFPAVYLPASGYDAWIAQITNGLTGYEQSAVSDGYANLLKYATGSNPTQADTRARMSAAFNTSGVFALQFNRSTNATDVSMLVQGATSADSNAVWSSIVTNVGGAGWNSTNVTESGTVTPVTVTVQDPTLATNRYLRLRVSRP